MTDNKSNVTDLDAFRAKMRANLDDTLQRLSQAALSGVWQSPYGHEHNKINVEALTRVALTHSFVAEHQRLDASVVAQEWADRLNQQIVDDFSDMDSFGVLDQLAVVFEQEQGGGLPIDMEIVKAFLYDRHVTMLSCTHNVRVCVVLGKDMKWERYEV